MLKTSFGKSAIGKLAIGVVAFSGVTVAHASSFGSWTRGTGFGGEFMIAPFHLKGKGLTENFTKPWEAPIGGATVNSRTLGMLGPIGFQATLGFQHLGNAQNLYNTAGNAAQVAESLKGKAPEVTDPSASAASGSVDSRSADTVTGLFSNIGARAVYDLTYFTRCFAGGAFGAVTPYSKLRKFYMAGTANVGIAYDLTADVTVEAMGRYTMPLDKAVNPVAGLAIALKYEV